MWRVMALGHYSSTTDVSIHWSTPRGKKRDSSTPEYEVKYKRSTGGVQGVQKEYRRSMRGVRVEYQRSTHSWSRAFCPLIYSKNIYQQYLKNFLLNNLKRFSPKKTMLPHISHIWHRDIWIKKALNNQQIVLIIENLWSIIDNQWLELNIENTDDLKTVWINISDDIIEKLFGSLPRYDQSKRFFLSFVCKDLFEIDTWRKKWAENSVRVVFSSSLETMTCECLISLRLNDSISCRNEIFVSLYAA